MFYQKDDFFIFNVVLRAFLVFVERERGARFGIGMVRVGLVLFGHSKS